VFDLNIKNKKDERGRERSFFSGVFLLSLSTVIVKLLGLGFKIPMLSFLGTEGRGYFNSA
jgi:O-antigen/teichoic acid export membrane protein